jgi:hypothetical protein
MSSLCARSCYGALCFLTQITADFPQISGNLRQEHNLRKQPRMQQPPRHQREATRDEDAADVEADHRRFVCFDVVAACSEIRLRHRSQREHAEEMNETKVPEKLRPDGGWHEERNRRRGQHQKHIAFAEQTMKAIAFAREHHVRADCERG